MSHYPTREAADKAEAEYRAQIASMLKEICPKQTWVQCPVCGPRAYSPNLIALYFNEESKNYENACPDCHAALVLHVTLYEGEV